MAYIGKTPQVGNYVKLDAITTSSTNTYNLTQDSVAFTPESALHMMVSLNGVIQAPLTSFSVSGSTITFLPSSGTLSSSDTIDFILVLGNVLDIGTPSDSTVTNAKTNFASSSSAAGLQIKGDGTSDGTTGTLQLNCSDNSHGIKLASPAHTHGQNYTLTFPTTAPVANKALITDGSGNLSFGSAGKVLQVVSATPLTSQYYSGTDSYMSTTLSLQITPSATTSKIFLQYSVTCHNDTGGGFVITDIYKDPTSSLSANTVASGGSLLSGKGASGYGFAQTYDAGDASISNQGVSYMDSPSTTSQILYLVVYRNHSGGNAYFNINNGVASFTAMEIGA